MPCSIIMRSVCGDHVFGGTKGTTHRKRKEICVSAVASTNLMSICCQENRIDQKRQRYGMFLTCGVLERTRRCVIQKATQKVSDSDASTSSPSNAKEFVEEGLAKFEEKEYSKALEMFYEAMKLSPKEDEMRAALYNAACAHAKLGQWQDAADAIVRVVNDYNLKLVVALRDPDLAELRERKEWVSALDRAAGGVTSDAYIKLRAEAKNPFRPARILIFGALAAGASLGLAIIATRLLAALRGGEEAPDLAETAKNFGINAAATVAFAFLLWRDLQADKKAQEVVAKEEELSSLEIRIKPDKIVPLASLRGTIRPVILTGSKGHVTKAIREAERYKQDLRARGVSLIPVILSDDDPEERLRRLKQEILEESSNIEAPLASSKRKQSASQGFGGGKSTLSSSESTTTDRKWQLEPYNTPEWEAWAKEQVKSSESNSGLNFYVQVQLDGSVRASGAGSPPWGAFIDDLPKLDDVRTKLTDGQISK